MGNNNLQLKDKDYKEMAAKAVYGYVNKKFNGFFTKEDLEDLVSEVMMKMWKGRETYNAAKGEPFQWVWTIAKNAVKDAAQKKANQGWQYEDEEEDDDVVCQVVSPYRADDEVLRNEYVDGLFDKLKQDRDKRLLNYLLEEMECEEIARRENISAKAVYMAVFHLRQRLKKDTAA